MNFKRLIVLMAVISASALAKNTSVQLHDDWAIQDSQSVSAKGSVISLPSFSTSGWHPATVPSTVLGALVSSGNFGDVYFGKNLLQLPGSGHYFLSSHFRDERTPRSSPFGRPWWYRTEFVVPQEFTGRRVDLHFNGITYGAEIWINGQRLARKLETEGTYRHFSFDVTDYLNRDKSNGKNVLAVLVSPPDPMDLTASWVDWSPTPQDKNMGLWREVYLSQHGDVVVENPQVVTKLDLPERKMAHLTVEAQLRNSGPHTITGKLIGTIFESAKSGRAVVEFSQTVKIESHMTVTTQFRPETFPQLNLAHPKLWWPKQMGTPHLYRLNLRFVTSDKREHDASSTTFGIRQIDSHLNAGRSRLYTINGLPILIRGGGWSSDLLLRFNHRRLEKELRYVQDLGLNTIRLEGRFETEKLLDLTDRLGILVMPGWTCCNAWQYGDRWPEKNYDVAELSLRDQILELRKHPSVFVFLYGSDEAPPEDIEKIYIDTFKRYHWPNPILSAATELSTPYGGETGVKMEGPYEYVPPRYWFIDKKYGGAYGFNTETSPGPAVPPIESLKEFISPEHLWPIGAEWNFHAGRDNYSDIHIFTRGQNYRYGESHSAEEFAMKAQVMAYDGHRAMFEAFGKNKYNPATGVIQWMLNNPWPSLIWHLYDYSLRPGGSYFGTKKANEPVHIQYSYDDQSIVVVNSTYQNVNDVRAKITVMDAALNVVESANVKASIPSDSSKVIYTALEPKLTGKLYFVKLSLDDASGVRISDNFYWLSTDKETYRWWATNSQMTPVVHDADLTELNGFKPVTLKVSSSIDVRSRTGVVTLSNPGQTLAFFAHVRLVQKSGDVETEILPILWQDNYVSLLPGEKRSLKVEFPHAKVGTGTVEVRLDGYNVNPNSF